MGSDIEMLSAHSDVFGTNTVVPVDALPTDWKVMRFDEVVRDVASGDWGEEQSQKGYEACRVLRGTDFRKASSGLMLDAPTRFIRPKSIIQRQLAADDLLIELSGGSKDQPTGRVLLITERLLQGSDLPVIFSNFVKRLRLTTQCSSEYFELYWDFLYRLGRTRIYEKRTTGIRNFKLTDFLENESILLPPLDEQRAIAQTLRAVQQAREATEAVIAATREVKASLMRHLFTYGPVPVDQADQVALRETEIGPVPEHWPVVSLASVLREKVKNGYSARESPTGQGIRTLTLTAVTQNDFGPANTKVTSADARRVADLWLQPGDILVERANTRELVGLAALYEGPQGFAIYPDLMTRVRVDERMVDTKFITEFMLSPAARRYFQTNARGTAGNMPKISHGVIEALFVPVPPMPEQQAIAEALQAVDQKRTVEESRRQALDALFQTLLHHLMTGQVRVADIEPMLARRR